MTRSTKQDWLEGPGDLEERTIEDCPIKGKSIIVQALSAAAANKAQTDATEVKATPDGGAVVTVNKAKMEAIQFANGVKEPHFDEAESQAVSEKFGPAFRRAIDAIDELSAIDKEAIEKAQARFPGIDGETPAEVGEEEPDPAAASNGDGGSDLHAPVSGAAR